MSSSGSATGTSTQQVLTSIVTNSVIFGAFFGSFLLLRIKLKRIYEPKSSFNLINDEKKPDPLPAGPWQWFFPLLKKSDNFIIQQAGLDGYFFLRYLFIISAYCAVSIVYIFPILLPINATNGVNSHGLDMLAYQNVLHRGRYYAHTLCGWIFFWVFLYIIYRELYFYNSMKQNILSSNRYAKKLSSRTVLFQTVPKQYLSETEFSKLFDGVKRVWIARSQNDLEEFVKERDAMAFSLEATINSYLKENVKKINKLKKKEPGLVILPDIHKFAGEKHRPKHRLSKWKWLFSKKVDTLDFYKENLPILNEKVKALQSNHVDAAPFNSVFVEFESQYQAQVASQLVAYHAPLFLTPAYVGIEPKDIVWFNLRMLPYERLLRRIGSIAFICTLVILWAFPVAFVGMISNITYLTDKIHWLNFIYKLPYQLLGLITSLAPTVALAVLMMLLPKIIRAMAIIGGAASYQEVELFTQQSFFAFQVIQVFLVTTIASAATSTVTQIIEDPTSSMELLATNLPKASNFFIAYLILQGMSVSSGALLQIVPLAIYYIFGAFLDPTPRKKFTRFVSLSSMSWGTAFPVYTNLTVIIFSYAIISPIILLFGACGFFLLWVAYLYNLNFVFKEAPDSRGVHYPRAMFQSIVGIYIGQICLLGLFVVGKGWGPIVLQAIGLAVTVLIHFFLNHCFDHLISQTPIDTMRPLDGVSDTVSFKNIYKDGEKKKFADIKELPQFPIRKYLTNSPSSINSEFNDNELPNAVEYQQELSTMNQVDIDNSENNMFLTPLLADGDPAPIPFAPFWKRFFMPHTYSSYKAVKTRLPEVYHLIDPEEIKEEDIEHAYDYPAVSAKCPYLWLPRDPYGFSQNFIDEYAEVIKISDRGATIDETGKITFEGKPPSYDDVESNDEGDKDSEVNSINKMDPFSDSKKLKSDDTLSF